MSCGFSQFHNLKDYKMHFNTSNKPKMNCKPKKTCKLKQ